MSGFQAHAHTKGDILLEFPAHDVREDLKFPVLMRAEAGLGVDTVLVDDTKRAKLLVLRVTVSGRNSAQLFCDLAGLE